MGITDKTRKLIWGKSGNRCAMCRHELFVEATLEDDESIIGDKDRQYQNGEIRGLLRFFPWFRRTVLH